MIGGISLTAVNRKQQVNCFDFSLGILSFLLYVLGFILAIYSGYNARYHQCLRKIRNVPYFVFSGLNALSFFGGFVTVFTQAKPLFFMQSLPAVLATLAVGECVAFDTVEMLQSPFNKRYAVRVVTFLGTGCVTTVLLLTVTAAFPDAFSVVCIVIAGTALIATLAETVFLFFALRSTKLLLSIALVAAGMFYLLLVERVAAFFSSFTSFVHQNDVFIFGKLWLVAALALNGKYCAESVLLHHTHGVVRLPDHTYARIIAGKNDKLPKVIKRARGKMVLLNVDLNKLPRETQQSIAIRLYGARASRLERAGLTRERYYEDVQMYDDKKVALLKEVQQQLDEIPRLFRKRESPSNKDEDANIESNAAEAAAIIPSSLSS